jgi:TPP-dependent pyruvate/acetoin dehydrogenase alpha subunit
MEISKKIKKNLFFNLLRIRRVEEEISNQYFNWKMRCPVHLSIGQESIPVSICENLYKTDEVVTAHRSHAHYLAKGGDLKKMLAEIHGKETGCAKGLGGSMHLIDLSKNIKAAVPIVGSTLPIGVGIAWANKLKKKNNIVVIFFGDGASEEGVFLESLDFACLHSLNILFVCENNKFSVYSNILKRQNKKRKIYNLARAIGIKSKKLKDHDLLDVYLNSKKIIENMRKKNQPYLIEIDTYRKLEHCGPNFDDNLNYRTKNEVKFWNRNCQVAKYTKKFLKNKILSDGDITKTKKKIDTEISNAFRFSNLSKYPSKKNLLKYVYKKEL